MKYEYKVLDESKYLNKVPENKLNELGELGYHMIHSGKDGIVLEREKEEIGLGTNKSSSSIINNYLHSLWHDKNEIPHTPMFVQCIVELEPDWHDGRRFVCCNYHKGSGFAGPKGWIETTEIVKWAYMADFLECV